jgi:hypothetical protein
MVSADAHAHPRAAWRLSEVDWRRRWAELHDLRWCLARRERSDLSYSRLPPSIPSPETLEMARRTSQTSSWSSRWPESLAPDELRWHTCLSGGEQRGVEGLRESCEDARVSCGGGLHFIGVRGRRHRSWLGRAAGDRQRAASLDPEVEDDGPGWWVPPVRSIPFR